jgi:hypothetical protein
VARRERHESEDDQPDHRSPVDHGWLAADHCARYPPQLATAALEARVPVEVVAARLGDTARIVQEVYQHHIPTEDEAAALLVGDLYRAHRRV